MPCARRFYPCADLRYGTGLAWLRPPWLSADVPRTKSKAAPTALSEASSAVDRQLLAIEPPIDVAKTPRKPGHYEEPTQLPYIGGAFRPIECATLWRVAEARMALDSLDAGTFQKAALMMEEMLRDDAVYHGYITRSGRLFGLRQTFMPSPRRGGKRAARIWQKYQRLIFPQGCKREIMKYLYFFKFALCSITWIRVRNTDGAGPPFWLLPQFKVWHPYWIRFLFTTGDKSGGVGGDQVNGHYGVITLNQAMLELTGQDAPGAGRWVLFQGAGARPWYDGIIRPLMSPWLRRVYTRRDHARFEEKHGLPITKVKYPTYFGGENKEWQAFERALGPQMGSEGVVMCPHDKDKPEAGVDVEFEGPPNAAAVTSFVESKKEEDRDIYTLWLGQSLTTEAGQGNGSHAAVIGQERRIDDKARDDSMLISDAEIDWYDDADGQRHWRMVPGDGPIREQIGRFFAWYNFGDPDLAPYDFIDATPDQQREQAARVRGLEATANQRRSAIFANVASGLAKLAPMLKQKPDIDYVLEQMGVRLQRPKDDPAQELPGALCQRWRR